MWSDVYQKTSMIGSLPNKTGDEAIELLEKYPLSIPAWPQLPKRSFKESMIPQCSEGFPGIKVDEVNKKIWVQRDDALIDEMTEFYENVIAENVDAFVLSPEYARGFYTFCDHYTNKVKFNIVKGQLAGPFTFGLGMNDNEGKALWFDEQYRDIVLKGLLMKALWQIKHLSQIGKKVVMFFDEPIFSALGTPGYLGIQDEDVIAAINEIVEGCHSKNAAVGIHCCGNMDWGLLSKTDIDIIAFDAFSYGDKVALYPDDLTVFLNRGGTLGWGLIPTLEPDKLQTSTKDGLKKAFDDLLDLFVQKGMSESVLLKQIIITPSCGMGNLSPEEAERVLQFLADYK